MQNTQDKSGSSFATGFQTGSLSQDLTNLTRLGETFGSTMTRAFSSAAVDGRKLSSVLRTMMQSLSSSALSSAIRPLSNLAGTLLGGVFGKLTASAKGNVVAGSRIRPFASGGIVGSPTLFPLNTGFGLMGESGPEAIMPLARGSDGRLGVRGSTGQAVNLSVAISSPDAEGFRRSRSQIASALLRALDKGRRNQ